MSKSLFIKNLAIGFSIFFLAFAVLCFVMPEPVFADSKYITYDIGYVNTHTTQYTDFQTLLYNAIDQGLQQYSFISSSTSSLVAAAVQSKMYDFGLVDNSFSVWNPENPDFYFNASLVVSNESLGNHKYLVIVFYPTSGMVTFGTGASVSSTVQLPGVYMYDSDGFLLTGGHSFYSDSSSPNHQSFWVPAYIKQYSNAGYIRLSNSTYTASNFTASENDIYKIPVSEVVGSFPYGGSFSSSLGLYTFGLDSSASDSQLYTAFDYQMLRTDGKIEFCFDLGIGSDFTLPSSGQTFGHFSYGAFYPVYTGRDYDSETDHTGFGVGHYPVFSFGYTYNAFSYDYLYNAGSTFDSSNGRVFKLYMFASSFFQTLEQVEDFFTGSPGYHEVFRISDVAPGQPTPTPIPSYAYATPTPFPTYNVSVSVTPVANSYDPVFEVEDSGTIFGNISGYVNVFSEFLDGSVFAWARNVFQRFVTFGSDPVFSVLVFLPVIGLVAFVLGRLLFK